MQTKTIEGTWWDFQHQNMPEGKYFNPALAQFGDDDWRQIVREAVAMVLADFEARGEESALVRRLNEG